MIRAVFAIYQYDHASFRNGRNVVWNNENGISAETSQNAFENIFILYLLAYRTT